MKIDRLVETFDGSIHVLLVDDESSILGITQTLLERIGYIVQTAYSGKEAIDLIEEYHDVIDVIIAENSMPGMNGIELALAAREFSSDTPIILFTGKIGAIDRSQFAEAGIAKTINKPCKIHKLDSIIKEIISKRNRIIDKT